MKSDGDPVLKGKALAMDKLFMKSKLPGNRALADVQAMIEESVYSPFTPACPLQAPVSVCQSAVTKLIHLWRAQKPENKSVPVCTRDTPLQAKRLDYPGPFPSMPM